ncbi:MAG: hypothetical protein SCK29_02270 [Bacillota bacterium]|nr:hypothetical protein [Bacillota bacterium]MDW7682927.1 hypothetical protein [Bacillota bacterium]
MTAGYKNIFTAEPIQWAVDYIQDILETLEEGAIDSDYGLALLALEREELRVILQELQQDVPKVDTPVFCAYGRQGARLFVIRQLLSTLPAVEHCPLHSRDHVYSQACRRLLDESFFLSGFRLSLEKKAPSPETVSRALRILAGSRLAGRLRLNRHPLHLYCLNYELPDPAYYLLPSHTIICGANDFDAHTQLHCLLHEFGHAIYAAKPSVKPAVERKKAAEQFANHFAAALLTSV